MKKIIVFIILILIVVFFFFINNQEKNQKKNQKKFTSIDITKEVVDEINNSKVDHSSKKNLDKVFTSNVNLSKSSIVKHVKNKDTNKIIDLDKMSEREIEKEVFSDIQLRMTKEMQTIPGCLENAINKQEALKCSKKLHEINKEFELLLGISTDSAKYNNTNSFVWNEETKNNMIKELDLSIQPMQELFSCFESADNKEEQEKCLEIEQ